MKSGTAQPDPLLPPDPSCLLFPLNPVCLLVPLCLLAPNPTGNRIYVVFLPKHTIINDFGTRSCQSGTYGAYHFQIPSRMLPLLPGTQGRPINMAIIPTECFGTLEALMVGVTHEIVEAALSPLPIVGGWVDESTATVAGSFDISLVGSLFKAGEAADICAGTSAPSFNISGGLTVSVAPYWSNADNACSSLDVDPPVTTASAAPPPNGAGWNNTTVTMTLTATDAGTPASSVLEIVHSATGAQPIGVTTTVGATTGVVVSAEGQTTVSFFARDNAGNVEAPKARTIRIDRFAPTIVGSAVPPANGTGWNNTPVEVSFTCTDAVSGIASCSAPTILFSDGVAQSVVGTAIDRAQNVAATTVTGINIDRMPPSVTYTGNAGTYEVNQTVNITCAAADNLSGVAATTCANVTGPAFSFGLGPHTFSATASDAAGNSGSGSVTFRVEVSFASLCSVTQLFSDKPGVAMSLCAKLDAAAAAANPMARAGLLGAYRNEVQAQTGKALTAAEATTLITFANAL